MLKWIVAAFGVVVFSLAISFGARVAMSDDPDPSIDPHVASTMHRINRDYESVSMIRLLANPDHYDGRKVSTEGFVTLGFEDYGLHLDETSYRAGLWSNALRINRPGWLLPADARRLHRRYASVAGTFVAPKKAILYSGTMTDLKLISPTYTPAKHEQWKLRIGRNALLRQLSSVGFLTTIGWCALGLIWALRRGQASSQRG